MRFVLKPILPLKACLTALLLAAVCWATPAQAQLGLAAGLNFDSLNDIDTGSRQASFDNATGYHVGVFFDLGAGPIALRPGIFYRDLGEIETDLTGLRQAFDLTLIEIPIDVRIRPFPLPVLKPYVTAGPVLTFPQSTDEGFDASLEDFSVSANIGAGLEISLPGMGLKLLPEIRYALGITRFTKEEFELGGISFRAEDTQQLNSVMLRVGIAF